MQQVNQAHSLIATGSKDNLELFKATVFPKMMDPNNHKWRVRPDFVSTVADISNAEYKRIFNEISQNCHSEFQVYIDTLYNCKVLISDSEILTTGFQCKEAGKLVYKLLQQLVVENYPIAWTDKLVFVA